ncbi:hypothetical protein GLOTRDRAFT_137918 [Gloeophyllum trabeum ATCC 11539]|uniref:Mug135-like C-terminal domain-containing protein n=1 Tax=Gloeophyllum trabeum (strain ATCC 11539 / FP-39264 / Madison 617) TaxID=670483 RepID=S7RSL3_GLOTA|nr:uncharacterized protein GLOTRDRAFT_137918 [Gloeophyllum trabeum ATCC 11539]EPQ57660.1 hypothetical protein GLOTRDRAFT_137918 [Gloeophyllum trabeum ATCC 11539]
MPFNWPAPDELLGVQPPRPISDPPSLKDLSNVYRLQHDLFRQTKIHPNEVLGRLVLLEHNLCEAVAHPAAPQPQQDNMLPQAIQALQQGQGDLLQQIQLSRAEATAAAAAAQQTMVAVQQLTQNIQAVQQNIQAVALRVQAVEDMVTTLTQESRKNHGVVAKMLNSMQAVDLHVPLLIVPFANNELSPQDLQPLLDRFTVHNLPADQHMRYFHGYYPGEDISGYDEDAQVQAILRAIGCNLVEDRGQAAPLVSLIPLLNYCDHYATSSTGFCIILYISVL